MQLYLVRHLKTDWNQLNKLQGSKDIPISSISDNEKEEIETLKKHLATIKFDIILCSEQIRTQQTAQAINYSTFQIEPLLNELNFGEFEGKNKSVFTEVIGGDWVNNCLTLELGEKLTSFQQRLISFVEKYKRNDHILVIGHGAVIRGLKALNEEGTIRQMNTYLSSNLSLVILEF